MSFRATEPLDLLRRYRGVAALVAAAAFVRFSGLSEWWLNPDEGIYFSLITRASWGAFWQEVVSNAHPPLYYILLRMMGLVTWDFSVLRAFSVLCGAAAVAGAWAVAHVLAVDGGGRADQRGPGGEGIGYGEGDDDGARSDHRTETRGIAAGFLAAFIVAFAPSPVQLSQVMRPYAFQVALLSWSLFFLLRHLRRPSGRDMAGYLTLLCLALLTHYSSVLAMGVFVGVVAVHGLQRGLGDRSWRILAAWHALPVAVVALLYALHLRPLAASALADEALDGWLSYFMIRSPGDVWMSLLGFQHHLGGAWLRGPLALLTLATLALAAVRRDMRVLVLAGGALAVAVLVAALGAYPFGSTRHSAWVTVFVVPAMGWFGATVLEMGSATVRRRVVLAGVVLLVVGGPLGTLIGSDRTRWAPTERVLRESYLQAMLPELDPNGEPELMVMSDQTFNLLLPFYPAQREEAVFSADSSAFHFPYGDRRILVSRSWAFLSLENGPSPTDLREFIRSADREFAALGIRQRDRLLFVDGGWGLPVAVQIQQAAPRRPLVVSSRVVPGLHAFVVRTGELLGTGG